MSLEEEERKKQIFEALMQFCDQNKLEYRLNGPYFYISKEFTKRKTSENTPEIHVASDYDKTKIVNATRNYQELLKDTPVVLFMTSDVDPVLILGKIEPKINISSYFYKFGAVHFIQ